MLKLHGWGSKYNKLSKHFQRGQENEIAQIKTVITLNCCNKKESSIVFLSNI